MTKRVETGELTSWIHRSADGDPEAPDVFYRLTMDRVRAASAAIRRGSNPVGVGTGTLAQEGLLRLAQLELGKFDNSQHFFRVASKVLRRTFTDLTRHGTRAKRGPGCELAVEPESLPNVHPTDLENSLVLQEALEMLERDHPDLYQVYLLHWVYGLTIAESATFLGVVERTTRRHWRTARSLLALQLEVA